MHLACRECRGAYDSHAEDCRWRDIGPKLRQVLAVTHRSVAQIGYDVKDVAYLRVHRLSVPTWVVLPPFAIYAFVAILRAPLRRRRRGRRGQCISCGYNLKGLTELRCPECGREFVP